MANYKFKDAFGNLTEREIWNQLISGLQLGMEFYSVGSSPKTYWIGPIKTNSFTFYGGGRKDTEDIDRDSFVTVISKLKIMKEFNTNSSKHHFKGTKIYAKRSPFFGLLLTKGIIERE